MTAIESIKEELNFILKDQQDCLTSSGFVIPKMRYKYQELAKKAKLYREAIEALEILLGKEEK